MKRPVDICVISDVHLGTPECKVRELLAYLQSIQPQTLVFNGDFINLQQYRRRHFKPDHVKVIQTILQLSLEGTRVYYITGDEDAAIRRYTQQAFGNIHLREKLILQMKGKRYWIFHGDVIHQLAGWMPLISRLGNRQLEWVFQMGRRLQQMLPFLSKKKGLSPASMEKFEKNALQLALAQQHDYVICGHIHKPSMRAQESREGATVTYMNPGDWTQHLTALEYVWGNWTLYQYEETQAKMTVHGHDRKEHSIHISSSTNQPASS